MTKKLSKLSTAENSVQMSLKGGGKSTKDLELFINESKEELAGIASYSDWVTAINAQTAKSSYQTSNRSFYLALVMEILIICFFDLVT